MLTPIPLVLVHGLWDSPRLFRRLEQALAGRRAPLLLPHLPHGLGVRPLEDMASQLDLIITSSFDPDQPLDLLGFSMGGLIGRIWIQLLGGQRRTRRFFSVGSPQQGTLTAQPWPRWLLATVADMKLGSPLLRQLNGDLSTLQGIDCYSYYCRIDPLVVPSWRGVLPVGSVRALPVLSHQHLISKPQALGPIVADLLAP
ncbi:MAG: alpha/beta hydrolase [Cyanobacteria bacterium]|nr:alpha/beta hydrolase [Cyanobacteriota bacterium]